MLPQVRCHVRGQVAEAVQRAQGQVQRETANQR